MRKFIILLLITFILLFGCLSGNKHSNNEDKTQSNKSQLSINISEESNSSEKANISDEDNSDNFEDNLSINISHDYMNFTYNPNATLFIRFFDISQDENHHGRLIIINKDDFDIVIASVPPKKLDLAVSTILSNTDDVELFIIPSTFYLNQSLSIIKRVPIGTLIIPSFGKGIDQLYSYGKKNAQHVIKVENGQSISYDGITLKFLSPFTNEFTREDKRNNALVFHLIDRSFDMLFATDAAKGLLNKIIANYDVKADIVEFPYYGYEYTTTTTYLFLDKSKCDAIIIEGYKKVPLSEGELRDPRDTLKTWASTRNIEVFEVWNKNITISYYGDKYAIN